MRAIMLAAGVGRRLSGGNDEHPPKVLLDFGGLTLLQRHLDALRAVGVESLTLVVGYRSSDIRRALEDMRLGNFVRVVENKDFRRGSIVSLWTARETLAGGGDILFMDADVLYDPTLLRRLAEADGTRLLYDRRIEPGEEPIKICMKGGRPVDFGRAVQGCDEHGEWVGFLRLTGADASKLADQTDRFIAEDKLDEPMEEAVRRMVHAAPGAFGIVDVSDLPWIEIDFPEDVARARDVVLPQIDRVRS